jgi:hypothetical protein
LCASTSRWNIIRKISADHWNRTILKIFCEISAQLGKVFS